jgi:hypothetical protein
MTGLDEVDMTHMKLLSQNMAEGNGENKAKH